MLQNISIKARLIFVVSLLGIELVAGAAIGLFSLGKANEDLLSLYNDDVVCLGQLDHIIRGLNLNQLNIAEAVSGEPNTVNSLLDEVEKQKLSIDSQWKSYLHTRMDNDERKEAEKFAAAREKFVSEALQPAIVALRKGDTEQAAAIVHGPLKRLFLPVRTSIDKLLQIQLDDSKKMQQQSQAAYELVRNICLAGVCLGLIASGVIAALLIKNIVKPLNKAVEVATAVANGDLTHEITVISNDETGRLMLALSHMSSNLSQIVGRVRAGTDIIATASGEIAAGNLDLSARTEQQAAALEETASSMEELSSTVKQNAENARQANVLAMSASDVAAKGGSVMSEVVTTMKDINTSATKIAEIINVIEGISFQTNILALNAAVEAARAGEEGRGFAVVAGEVRSLAHRSAEAAKQVKALINESVEKVNSGSQLVDKAGATMTQIVASVDMVTSIMSEITSASLEQTAGIDQVARSIIQMDHSTQQNAALVEQASAAAQALHEQADTLAVTVGTFRLGRQGDAIAATSVGNLLMKGQPVLRLAT